MLLCHGQHFQHMLYSLCKQLSNVYLYVRDGKQTTGFIYNNVLLDSARFG